MKILRELSGLIGWEQVIACLDEELTPKQEKRIRLLFQRLRAEPATSTTEMARLLYGSSRTSSHPPFNQLLEQLSFTALKAYLDPSARYTSSPSRQAMVQRCERAYALLFVTGERSNEARIKHWHHLVKNARQCHHVAIELECQQVLQAIYGYRAYDEALLEETTTEIRRCIVKNLATTRCKMAAMDQRVASTEGNPYPTDIPLEEVSNAVGRYELFDIQYHGGEILTKLAIDRKDWPGALRHSGRALDFFRDHFPRERQPLIHFLYSRVLVFTALLDFGSGWACWEQLLLLCKKSKASGQLGKVIEIGMILTLRCGNTGKADILLNAIMDGGGTSLIPKREYGRWLTYLSGLALLSSDQPVVLELISTLERKLRREETIKFHQEDEQNLGVMKCITLLLEQNFRKAADIVAELRKQLPNRLSSSAPEYRLHLFLKLLVESATANFHQAATLRKTKKTLKRLRDTSPGIDDDGIDVELISFECLWEMLLSSLTEKAPHRPYLSA